MQFIVGLDLGQSQDYTALCILKRASAFVPNTPSGPRMEISLDCPHLQRWPLGTSYPAIVQSVKEILERPELAGAVLVVDQTGVGRPVIDSMKEAGLKPIPISITGGNAVTRGDDGGWHVPKRDLASTLQVLLQNRRIRFAASLPELETLIKEMQNFKVSISVSGHDSYGAGGDIPWREGAHDDLVLAVGLAAWWGLRPVTGTPVAGQANPLQQQINNAVNILGRNSAGMGLRL